MHPYGQFVDVNLNWLLLWNGQLWDHYTCLLHDLYDLLALASRLNLSSDGNIPL